MDFTLFEHDTTRYNTSEYIWKVNKNGVFEGFDIRTNKHKFSWQPHGSQFTIIYNVPISAKKFKVKRPPCVRF